MVFSSFEFILIFLPLVLMGAAVAQRFGSTHLKIWLIAASLVFYSVWSPLYVLVLLGSIVVNYGFLRAALAAPAGSSRRRSMVVVGITANLCLLGWFKYAGFLTLNINALFGSKLDIGQIILPLGISFFTFQKIALLVDIYRREVNKVSLLDYALFVTFFPQLIAGPIVLYPEIRDQYKEPGRITVTRRNMVIGLSIFAVGLLKKTMIADPMGSFATPVFAAAAAGKVLATAEAWTGALAYTLQLYFDFSGYSDMAIGLAAMFGIIFPFNFVSPYKAVSIIDFWRRWHVTLSRFLRVYLYIPLGGNRNGYMRRYVNLMTVMLLGGLWHGAAWTFVVWGGLHGLYLIVNHLWRNVSARWSKPSFVANSILTFVSWFVTFLSVVIAWVFFRADTFAAAGAMLVRMFDPAGCLTLFQKGYPEGGVLATTALIQTGVPGNAVYIPIAVFAALAVSLFMPNSQSLFRDRVGAWFGIRLEVFAETPGRVNWRPSRNWALAAGFMIAVSFLAITKGSSPFLYFNF